MARSSTLVTLVGYILPEKEVDRGRDAEGESDTEYEDEEEKQPEFLDMKEMNSVSSGGSMFPSSVPSSTEVGFMNSGRKCRVEGRFALRDPWWEISCKATRQGQKFVIKGYPSYSLRAVQTEDDRCLVPLLLNACGADSNFVTLFTEWSKNRHVEPGNVKNALNDFGKESNVNKVAADQIIASVTRSDAGFYVRAARMYPDFMRYMPTLLPGQFLELLKNRTHKENQETPEDTENDESHQEQQESTSILAELEELIKTDVWKLGFNYVMWKEFNLVRCEAKLGAFKDSGLFSDIPPLQQDALLVYDYLKSYCMKNGHTYIMRQYLQETMSNMNEIRIWSAVGFLRQEGVLKVEKQKISLRNLYNYETEIMECLEKVATGEPWKIHLDVREVLSSAQRAKADSTEDEEFSNLAQNGEEHETTLSHEPLFGSSPNLNDPVDLEPDPTPMELDPYQVRAAEMMCANPVTIISGKGGCGKTTVVSLVFKAAMKQQDKHLEAKSSQEEGKEIKENNQKSSIEVLLTAPTASLLTKRTSFTAYTMHQVLLNFMKVKKEQLANWMFANVRVLVVDEGSLVCVQILHSLLTILTKHAKLQKFILLGDIRQLPSIEPGNILNDLFNSLYRVSWAIEMQNNHRAESQLIVHNAGLIAEMDKKKFHPLEFDAVVNLSEPFTMPPPEKKFILILLPTEERDDDLQWSIKMLLEGCAPGLKDDRASQFIAFMRRDCALINELCCQHYSRHTTKTHNKKLNFQIGDKVCCTKNGYVCDQDKKELCNASHTEDNIDGTQKKLPKNRLCNGEIFFIKEDRTTVEVGKRGSKKRELQLIDESGNVVITAEYRELQRECKLRHAWARTIHTFQGSETKTIVYVVGDGKFQNWKHVYTAVTRGQQRVYVIAKQNGLQNAIQRRVINRNTRLAGLVTDMVSKLREERDDMQTQPSQFQFGTPRRGNFQAFVSQSPGSASPDFGGKNGSLSGHPGLYKRQNSDDKCATPNKQLKTEAMESPLGCTRLDSLCLDAPKPHGRNLFPTDPPPQDPQLHKPSQH
ncbi:DNA helicase B [Hoplias malabaricus]|uniref:DNA helicase B n=1 Tax=Hoplias malabaricus TaxID=27720 RepID=UPI0034632803